jgi:hypothetical protein
MSDKPRRGPATAEELRTMLRPLQEKKGYYFNKDDSLTLPLLEELLVTKERYGYMACPCRLANGESGRRRGYPRRPPTPPYVRFRIRRFMRCIETCGPDRAVSPNQEWQRKAR